MIPSSVHPIYWGSIACFARASSVSIVKLNSDLEFITYLSILHVSFINSKVKSLTIEKIKLESHKELEEMLTTEITQIDKDLSVICNNVPVMDKATMDILCHDSNGQLVILQLSTSEDDNMFLHGIQSLDYADKFKSFLKATYNKQKIDDKQKPRLILIAPSFSDAVRSAVEGMKGLRIDLYEWEYLKLGDQKGLRLQPIFSTGPPAKAKEEKPAKKEPEQKPLKKKEPEPEQMEEKQEPEQTTQSPQPEPQKEIRPEQEDEQHKRKLKLF